MSSENWKKALSYIEANSKAGLRRRINSDNALNKCIESIEADAANW